MGKKDKTVRDRLEVIGTIMDAHKGCVFDVGLEDSDMVITASISGRMRKSFIKVVTGDKVKVEVSPYDTGKGRIVQRMK